MHRALFGLLGDDDFRVKVSPDGSTSSRDHQTYRRRFRRQRKRWVIERTFAWACTNRRLARDVERAAETVRALFKIAMIKLTTRRFVRYRHF